jgi:signal transduction histidine kinase
MKGCSRQMMKNHIKKSFKIALLTALMLLFAIGCSNHEEVKHIGPDATKGELNLSNWDFESYGSVKLDGEWEFYWEHLLTPEDFKGMDFKDQRAYVKIPILWNKNSEYRRPANGYGTYRLKIITTKTPKSMALHIPLIQSAYKLWVNDQFVNENGVVGESKEGTINAVKNTFEMFTPDTNSFYLTLQVANFSEGNGGIGQTIELGDAANIVLNRERSLVVNMFIFGFILVLPLYHFILFAFRSKDRSFLMLGILSLSIGLVNFSLNNYAHVLVPEGVTFGPSSRLLTFFLCFILPSFCHYIDFMFGEAKNRKLIIFVTVNGAFNILVTLFLPPQYLSFFINYIQILAILIFLFCAKITIKAIMKKVEGSMILLAGLFVLTLLAINDILHNRQLIDTQYLSSWGIATFILSNTIMLTMKSSKSFSEVENLSEKLLYMDKIKDKLVEEKTKSIQLLLDNAEQGFLTFARDLKVRNEYSLECVQIFGRSIENIYFPELIYPEEEKEREDLKTLFQKVFKEKYIQKSSAYLTKISKEIEIHGRKIKVAYKIINISKMKNQGEERKLFNVNKKEGKAELGVEIYNNGDEEKDLGGGENRLVMAIFTDITEKKILEDQILQSEKMSSLGEIVSGVSHEINTPIGVSITAISSQEKKVKEMIKNYEENKIVKADFENFLNSLSRTNQIIATNLERASNLVQNFKKVSVDMSHEEERIFNVKDYIESILLALSPKLKKTKHVVKVLCDEDLSIHSFPGAMSQIITNLIMNSLTHAFDNEQTGKISIEALELNGEFIMIYSDDGKGIKEENMEKIFNPFFTTNRGGGGTGLGLNIVYNIITQALKGTIVCTSEEGQGCKFVIKIPIVEGGKM